MPADEPSWWYGRDPGLISDLLHPVARIWGWTAERRLRRSTPYRSSLPVICVGNFTAGGTGKTPLSIYIARLLCARGERPAFLTRGYGGKVAGPRRVDLALDTAREVGDEPLLLARHAPVMVARERAKGAAALEADAGLSPATVIVMDDGLQNPALTKDLVVAVVDGRRGLGNGRVIPAGPLRARIEVQMALTDAIVVNRPRGAIGDDHDIASHLRASFGGPVLEATVAPDGDAAQLAGVRVLALAGIANPVRFYDLLRDLGADVVGRAEFADHHAFSEGDAQAVLADAARLNARIVTTEKDWVRLVGQTGARAELRARATPVPIRILLEPRDADRLASLIDGMLITRRTNQFNAAAPSGADRDSA